MGLRNTVLAVALAICSIHTLHAKQQEVVCLANNIYFEARNQSTLGKLAVAKVTLNRVKHPSFPDTICKVVYQPGQFSWTANKRLRIRDKEAYKDSLQLAKYAYSTNLNHMHWLKALYFHSGYKPRDWPYKLVARIGGHQFYS